MAEYREPSISEEAVNAGVDAITALANSGKLHLYAVGSGAPTDADAAIGDCPLLAELTFGSPAFGDAGAGALDAGVAAATAITPDSDANATGDAVLFRVLKTDGTTVLWQGTVGPLADPQVDTYDLYMNSVAIQQHAAVSISGLTYTGLQG